MQRSASLLNAPAGREPDRLLDDSSICVGFRRTVDYCPDRIAVRTVDDEIAWSFAELRDRVDAFAAGLVALGVGRGDVVGLMFTNRPEFYVADTAVTTLGATTLSLYNTSTAEQIAYVLGDAGARAAVIEERFAPVVARARESLPDLEHVVVLEGASGPESLGWDEVLAAGDPGFDPEAHWRAIEPGDVLTLIYTSGTTGPPKGVQLTHRNMLVTMAQIGNELDLPDGATGISWLPAAHIAERQGHLYLPLVGGGTITTCPDPQRIAEYLQAVRPHAFFAVPRIWEKLRSGLAGWLSDDPTKQRFIDAGIRKVELELAGQPVPEAVAAIAREGEESLFADLRAMIGLDRALVVQTGAAPTPKDVLVFFAAIGLPILETWGMSEICGAGCSMPRDRIKLGTVGPPVAGGEVRLADDGELLFRGEQVMLGYRNSPEKTAETIDADGWVHTGDVATIDEDGYVRIVDRKKEIIINAAGKNMSPTNIESAVKGACPLVGQCAVIGDGRPYNTALVTLDRDAAQMWAHANGYGGRPLHEIAAAPDIRTTIERGIEAANAQLSRVEQIKRFELIGEEWVAGGHELTPTLKLKRKPIAEKYAEVIDRLYA